MVLLKLIGNSELFQEINWVNVFTFIGIAVLAIVAFIHYKVNQNDLKKQNTHAYENLTHDVMLQPIDNRMPGERKLPLGEYDYKPIYRGFSIILLGSLLLYLIFR